MYVCRLWVIPASIKPSWYNTYFYPSNPWPVQCQTVGASLGLKAACPNHNDQTCQIICQDPTNSQECIQLNSLLIDGSPCGTCCYLVQSEYFVNVIMSYRFRRYLSLWKVPGCWIFGHCQGSFVRTSDSLPYLTPCSYQRRGIERISRLPSRWQL